MIMLRTTTQRFASLVLAVVLLAATCASVEAADLARTDPDKGTGMPDGYDRPYVDQGPDADGRGLGAWRRREAAGGRYALECPDGLWRPPYGLIVPTNAPCDPTYVGSSFGLKQPSYYGTLPPPGYDAP